MSGDRRIHSTNQEEEMLVSDAEITPSEPDPTKETDGHEHGGRPNADDIPLPEERSVGGETVVADTASGGAPEPANGGDDE